MILPRLQVNRLRPADEGASLATDTPVRSMMGEPGSPFRNKSRQCNLERFKLFAKDRAGAIRGYARCKCYIKHRCSGYRSKSGRDPVAVSGLGMTLYASGRGIARQ